VVRYHVSQRLSLIFIHSLTPPILTTHDTLHISNENWCRTEVRIEIAFNLYYEFFGAPDIIIINTVLWDVRGCIYKQGTSDFDDFISQMMGNLDDRLHQIDVNIKNRSTSDTAHHVHVGLRTAPWITRDAEMIDEYNTRIRHLASVRHMAIFFDPDVDLWSAVNGVRSLEHQEHMFRDVTHPRNFYLASLAEKYLGYTYTTNMHFVGQNLSITSTEQPCSWATINRLEIEHTLLRCPPDIFKVNLLCSNTTISKALSTKLFEHRSSQDTYDIFFDNLDQFYFSPYHEGKRQLFDGLTNQFMESMALGPGDVLFVRPEILERFDHSGRIPNNSHFYDCDNADYLVITTDGRNFLKRGNGEGILESCRCATGLDVFFPSEFIIRDVDTVFADTFARRVDGPDIFCQPTLIRHHNERQVFMLDSYVLHPVNSMQALIGHGLDVVDDVKVLSNHAFLREIPIGAEFI
jgi:hypothetical protein